MSLIAHKKVGKTSLKCDYIVSNLIFQSDAIVLVNWGGFSKTKTKTDIPTRNTHFKLSVFPKSQQTYCGIFMLTATKIAYSTNLYLTVIQM